MQEEIGIGEWIRLKDGRIRKFKQYLENELVQLTRPYNIEKITDIVKHSKNIIDLIQVGDYVNRKLISNVDKVNNKNFIEWKDGEMYSTEIKNDNFIKSIVTKQQFESIEYKI